MSNSESVHKNATHKLLRDSEFQTDNLISTRRPDLIKISYKKKRTSRIVDFAVMADQIVKLKESEKRGKYFVLAREGKKPWAMKQTFISISFGTLCTVTEKNIKGTGGRGNKRTSWDNPNYSIVEIGQNTEKSPGDLRWLLVVTFPFGPHVISTSLNHFTSLRSVIN